MQVDVSEVQEHHKCKACACAEGTAWVFHVHALCACVHARMQVDVSEVQEIDKRLKAWRSPLLDPNSDASKAVGAWVHECVCMGA